MNKLVAVFVVPWLAACVHTTPPTSVHQPMSVRPESRAPQPLANGAIYQTGAVRPLFEDRRARLVGDTLTIQLVEKTQASTKSSTSAERDQTIGVSVPTISGLPFKTFQGMKLGATDQQKFSGKGDSAANNDFTGFITVTVIEVLPNGNLMVSGEKMVAINQGDEYIRFSGVVNPNYISGLNTVPSTQVADARIEYKATGFIDSAQVMGWLARFFLTVLPF
ncbi:MAG TPA: flagellar basal body L-ring protein FlgH [Rhodocyclaceae bacterium]|nr:flagellar basal body L-ring protein FlgH [Rhodocyclaceae bacterium]